MDWKHSSSSKLSSSTENAFQLAASSLTSLGFRIVTRDERSLHLTGPGMNSSRESPLVGASEIRFDADGKGSLNMAAELGGVKKMGRFVRRLIGGLAVFFAVLFTLLFTVFDKSRGLSPYHIAAISVLPLLPWIVLGPILIRSLKTRSTRALDALLDNMTVESSPE